MHIMINDLERMGDIYYQMSKTFEDMMSLEVALPREAVLEVSEFLDLILKAIKHMRENLHKVQINEPIDLDMAIKLEDEIDGMRDRMKETHYKRLEQGVYTSQAGVIFLDYIRIGRASCRQEVILYVSEY